MCKIGIMDTLTKEKSNVLKVVFVLGILVCVYFAVKVASEIKAYNFIGGGTTATNTISFDGKGEVTAAPDIATVSFSIRDDAKDLKTAQDTVTNKEKAILEFLDKSGIEKKDIKTENYSSYPRYDSTPCYNYKIPCRQPGTIIGYEVSEYVTVKVRDLTKVGEIVKGLGGLGVSDMNGPNFAIEKEDELKAKARKIAIDEAKAKAEKLADDLGIRLVRIVGFSDGADYPVYYNAKSGVAFDAQVSSAPEARPTPALPTGDTKIISNVSITYEIR